MNKIFLVCLGILLSGCVAQVKTYQKEDADITASDTWCWLQGCEITYQGPNQYYDQRVIDEIANEIALNMFQKGYVQGNDSSDLAVNYFIIVKEDSASIIDEYTDFITTTMYPQYEKFLKGSIIIDVIDRDQSALLWRGTAVRYLEIHPTYDKKMIQKVIAKAMKKFPSKKPD